MIDVYRQLKKGKTKILNKFEIEVLQKNFEDLNLIIEKTNNDKYKVRIKN